MKLIENISIVALVLTFLSGNMKNVGREVNVEEENTVVRSYASDDSFVFSDEPYAVSETSIVNKELKLLNKGVDKYKITTENGSFIVDSSEEKETSVNVPLQIAVGEGEQKILVEGMEGDDIVSEEETIISTLGTSEQFYASTLGYETIDKASLDYRLENELISEIEYENQIEKYTLASNSFGSNHNAFDSEDGGPSLDYPIEGRVMVNIDSNGLGYELKPVEGIRVKIEAYNGYDNIMSGYTQEITTDDNGFFLFPYIEEYFYYAYYFEITAYTETNYGNKKYNAKVVDNKKEVYFKKICVDHQNGKIQNSYDIILNNFSCDEDKAFVILYYLSKTVKYISSVDELKSKYETTLIQYPVGRTSFYSKAFDDVPIIGDIAEWRAPFLRGDISIQGTEGRDVYDNGRVILHEYGHFIADKLGVFNKVGGNHSLEDDFINDISLNDGRAGFGAQMAWNEGLADFISVVLNQKLYSKKDSKYSDYDLSSFYDEYGNTTFLRGLGEGNEIVTASIIYQFYKGSYFNGNERAIWSFLSKKQTKLL
ncbi:MAG: hypothetical protein LBM99_00190, partial [Bacillales bacterium]|nr:hypothetical protein [Bacillales bacterium]